MVDSTIWPRLMGMFRPVDSRDQPLDSQKSARLPVGPRLVQRLHLVHRPRLVRPPFPVRRRQPDILPGRQPFRVLPASDNSLLAADSRPPVEPHSRDVEPEVFVQVAQVSGPAPPPRSLDAEFHGNVCRVRASDDTLEHFVADWKALAQFVAPTCELRQSVSRVDRDRLDERQSPQCDARLSAALAPADAWLDCA